jgi:hypothetical protein
MLKMVIIAYFCAKNHDDMIRIPYGLSDFNTIRVDKQFYQDRTEFIQ